MNPVYLLTGIEGRISRLPFWIALIVLVAIEVTAHHLFDKPAATAVSLILSYPEFAVLAKRGHDRNVPTWVAGLFVAAGVIANVLEYLNLLGTSQTPSTLLYAFGIPLGLATLILIIDFGFRRGTAGPNRYGPDPLQPRSAL